MRRASEGFTAVELLVAIIVAMLLLGSAYQLYSSVIRDSAVAQLRTVASNAAYDLMRQYQQKASSPCATLSETPALPSYANLSSTSVTAVISCPFGTSSNLSLVTITVNYNDPNPAKVIRAITTRS